MAYIYSQWEKQIWDYLVAEIGNDYGVAGLMGNLAAESILSPGRIQGDLTTAMNPSNAYTSALNNGSITEYNFVNVKSFTYNGTVYGPAYGLAQWDYYARRQNYWDFWHTFQHGVAGDLYFELWFLMWELQNEFSSVLNTLRNATSVRQASDKVLHDFENPSEQGTAVEIARANMGQRIYDQYHGSQPEPPTPPVPTPSRKLPIIFYLRYPF